MTLAVKMAEPLREETSRSPQAGSKKNPDGEGACQGGEDQMSLCVWFLICVRENVSPLVEMISP